MTTTTPITTPVEPRPLAPGKLPIDSIIDTHSAAVIAGVMNVTERTVQRWRYSGVNGYVADRLAVKVVGDTPDGVWGRDWENAFPDVDLREDVTV